MKMEEFDKPKKEHRKRQAGKKADKKKPKTQLADDEKSMRERNPKAFAIQNVAKTERRVRRKEDISEKRKHLPSVDRTVSISRMIIFDLDFTISCCHLFSHSLWNLLQS